MVTSSLKYHGGKQPISDWIISHFTPHTHYVEPYCGAAHVLYAKSPDNCSEVINDLDERLMTFWRVLQDPAQRRQFIERCAFIPVSQALFNQSKAQLCTGPYSYLTAVEKAVAFFVVARQSMSGRQRDFAPLSKSRTRRGMNEQVSALLSAVEGLPQAAERLRRVVLYCEPALRIIEREDSEHTLFYIDPPYMPRSRAAVSVYRHEMTADEHAKMLAVLRGCKGAVLLSGYRSAMYDAVLHDWNRYEHDVPNHAACGEHKRNMVECLWSNRP